MKPTVKAAIITGICTIIAGGASGAYFQKEYINSQIANVSGDNNTVNINSVDDLIKKYEELDLQNSTNLKNYDKVSKEYEELSKKLNNNPTVELKNLGLFINGEEINVNKSNAYAIINGTEYFTKEFLTNIICENLAVSIKDDNMYIGRIVSESADLFEQRIISAKLAESEENATDSYGNIQMNVMKIYNGAQIILSLNQKYSLLKFKIAIDEDSNIDAESIITIFADDKLVYTSPKLEKVDTKEFTTPEININNCSVLEIKCSGDSSCYPLIYDATVYN